MKDVSCDFCDNITETVTDLLLLKKKPQNPNELKTKSLPITKGESPIWLTKAVGVVGCSSENISDSDGN